MEKRLRIKFTLYSFLAFLIVFILIFSLVLFDNYSKIGNRAKESIDIILEHGLSEPGDIKRLGKEDKGLYPEKSFKDELPFSARYFTVKIDSNRQLKDIDISRVIRLSSDEAFQIASEAISNDKDLTGRIKGGYFYKIVDFNDEQIVIFLDISRDLDIFYNLLRSSVVIGLLSLVTVSFISYLLSKRAVEPILKGYRKQKTFITDASHELKTPVAILSANNEVLELVAGESEWTISNTKQIKRLRGLIDALVSIAKLDEEELLYQVVETNLSHLTGELVKDYEQAFLDRNISIRSEIEDDIKEMVNKEDIIRLLSILLDNALKYTNENGRVLIRLSKNKQGSILSMENTSDNLKIGDYEKLFGRFYREDESRNSETGGFGLGLSIARLIAEKNKIKLSAKSFDGKSLVFNLIFSSYTKVS